MLDITTIFALVVLLFVFVQLRNVLGKRTGHERPPFDPYTKPEEAERRASPDAPALPDADGDKVVTLPMRDEDAAYREIDLVAPKSSAANKGMRAIRDVDPNFSPRSFLDGARQAYEMVVTAFAQGDRDTLRMLLAPDVYEGFEAEISRREAAGHTVRQTFVGIDEASIDSAAVRDGEAFVAVRFLSQVIQATLDGEDNAVDGDPDAVVELRDVWTFARDVDSDDPNWKLVATEAETD